MPDENDNGLPEEDGAVNIATDPVASMVCEKCDAQIDVSELQAFTDVVCPQCGHQAQVPAQLGPFRLLRLLGMGGMGGVYQARDETLRRFVAIKVMLKSLGDDESFVETFKREAQAVAKLNHPNIAQIYSFGQEKGQPYIVMELIKGRHLDNMIEEEDSLSETLVLRVVMEVASGLAAADDIGLIHGDIKPENILLNERGHSKLVDFGLATFADQQAQEGIWGTPYYIAPEKVRRQRTDARSDIYSLGATMFHALTGHPPFQGETPVEVVNARLNNPAPLVSSRREGVDPDVERIVARMLEVEPGRRYPTYKSLISDLKKTLDKLGPDAGLAQAVRSKKLVIKKRGTKGTTKTGGGRPPPTSRKIVVSRGAGRMSSSTSVPSAQPGLEGADGRVSPKKKRSKAPRVVLILILIFSLIGGGIVWGLQTLEQRAQQALLTERRADLKDAHKQGAALCEEGAGALGLLTEIEAAAMAFYNTAAADVLAVEAAPLPAPRPPAAPEPEPEPGPAAAGTNEVAVAVATNEAAAAAEPGPEPDADPAEAAAPEPEPEPEPDPDPEAEGEAEPEAEIADPAPNESLIMTMGRRAVEACEAIMGARAEAERRIAEAEALNDSLQECRDIAAAKALLAEIEERHAPLPGLVSGAREALAKAEEASQKTAEWRAREEEKQRKAREAAAEEARKQAEREAAERKAAAARAKIDAELGLARMDEAAVREQVSLYQYDDAARRLKLSARNYHTKEGKAAIAHAIERYELLEGMKQYFIARLSEAPLRWGYVDGPNRVDVLSANRVGIRINTGLVPWRDVSPRQMAEFIKHYVRRDALSQGVKLRELADYNVGAAIFCSLNGWHEAAKSYGDAAITLLATMQDEVERLVPPAPEDEE